MTDDRYQLLQPPNLVPTLRSLPRRFSEALASAPPDPETLHLVHGGVSAHGLLDDTVRALTIIDRALEQTLIHDDPTVLAAVMNHAERHWPDGPKANADDLLGELQTVCERCAKRIEHTPTADWDRKAIVVGGPNVRAIDIAREAARTGAENLRRLEALVRKLPRT